MNTLNFDNVTFQEESKYLKPGNYVVTTTEVKHGLSAQKQSPYVELTVANEGGQTASQQYYLTTTVKEGSNNSAFNISAQQILRIVAAVNNLDINTEEGKTKAKSYLAGISTPEQLSAKLSNLLVGKKFAIHLDGKWVNPTDTSKKPWIKAEFGTGNFAVPVAQIATLKAEPNIKGSAAPATTAVNTSTNADW